jgi:hypothetical protein
MVVGATEDVTSTCAPMVVTLDLTMSWQMNADRDTAAGEVQASAVLLIVVVAFV